MEADFFGDYLRQTSCVLYLAVDSFIPVHGKPFDGLDEFNARLDHAGVPAVSSPAARFPSNELISVKCNGNSGIPH
jgi:hypothetical protein